MLGLPAVTECTHIEEHSEHSRLQHKLALLVQLAAGGRHTALPVMQTAVPHHDGDDEAAPPGQRLPARYLVSVTFLLQHSCIFLRSRQHISDVLHGN